MSAQLPDGIDSFLANAGWGGAVAEPLPGDASFRRYFRIRRAGRPTAMLMHAPPPHEDPGPFLHVGNWLLEQGMRAPAILATDLDRGLVLIEDFGHDRMRDWLELNPEAEEATYRAAIDALLALRRCPPGPFAPYDEPTYLREVALFFQWFCPAAGLDVDEEGFLAAWSEVLRPVMSRQYPGVCVLRDYHAENIMLMPDGAQGIIDFQDALVGHPAYDLVSLLQDARRDVSPELEQAMLDYYLAHADAGEDFLADYAVLGAQRNAKIVGIFTRLWRRDSKPRYLSLIPRVWEAMERDLAHPALGPVARWFDANVPAEWRARRGDLTQ
ncbi:aminoglycoside phosphotransferase family protein [Altererythrobacter lauratis]|uniref:Aminoglycoside phosphotransferase family protein n=1 Tax=Alteraurantiacibacter lauratis TaxID=2054627 RepID=A0ABV7EA93_9SPHN